MKQQSKNVHTLDTVGNLWKNKGNPDKGTPRTTDRSPRKRGRFLGIDTIQEHGCTINLHPFWVSRGNLGPSAGDKRWRHDSRAPAPIMGNQRNRACGILQRTWHSRSSRRMSEKENTEDAEKQPLSARESPPTLLGGRGGNPIQALRSPSRYHRLSRCQESKSSGNQLRVIGSKVRY